MERYFSPPDKSYPQILPDYWKFEDGNIVTNLQNLSDEELNNLGWSGPILMPEDDPEINTFTHKCIWNSNELKFNCTELTIEEKISSIDFPKFLDLIIGGYNKKYIPNSDEIYENSKKIYQKIRNQAVESLKLNISLTELITTLSITIHSGAADTEKLVSLFNEIFSIVSLTNEEISTLREIFMDTRMYSIYQF